MLKKIILCLLAFGGGLAADAFKITIDGVVYNCNKENKRASCQGPDDAHYDLKKVVIADQILHETGTYTVTSIAKNAFNGCTELKTVSMGNAIETIGSKAFSESGVTKITLSESLKIIGERAFYNADMESVKLPESVEIIRAHAFQSCTRMKKITFGRSLKEIGDSAFWWCWDLQEAMLPNSVTKMGIDVFNDCIGLKRISIPDKLTTIPPRTYYNCPIENLVIPAAVQTIGERAFVGCNTPTLVIPGTVKTIGPWAFCGAESTELIVSEGVPAIGEAAFYECRDLLYIVLPSTLTSIGSQAFIWCDMIQTVTVNRALPPVCPDNAFEDYIYDSAQLKVPDGTEQKYLSATGWRNFKSLQNIATGVEELTTDADNAYIYYDLSGIRRSRPESWMPCKRVRKR